MESMGTMTQEIVEHTRKWIPTETPGRLPFGAEDARARVAEDGRDALDPSAMDHGQNRLDPAPRARLSEEGQHMRAPQDFCPTALAGVASYALRVSTAQHSGLHVLRLHAQRAAGKFSR